MNQTIFLYGPQTSGKTTRLLNIIKRDHSKDILMSGEDKSQISNGREVCDITLRVPKKDSELTHFIQKAKEQCPVKHVLIDGAQFLSKAQIKAIARVFNQIDHFASLVFAGCRYYISDGQHPSTEIPTSHFLLQWCDQSIPVDRKCDFCQRLATRLFINGFKHLSGNKIVAVDPHLVCDPHYQKLRNKHEH